MSAREFVGVAMPAGDRQLGLHGPLVRLIESENGRVRRDMPMSEPEARSIVAALNDALRTLDAGRRHTAEGGGAASLPRTLADPRASDAGRSGRAG